MTTNKINGSDLFSTSFHASISLHYKDDDDDFNFLLPFAFTLKPIATTSALESTISRTSNDLIGACYELGRRGGSMWEAGESKKKIEGAKM